MQAPTVLSVHNHYQQAGGEDRVFAAESDLLERMGHTVIRYEDSNRRVRGSIGTGIETIWSRHSHFQIESRIRSREPQLVHFHNTFPLISPSAYYAVRRAGVPVVQTLHNFRLICAGATLSRKGVACESCIGRRSVLPGIAHACYRDSRPATAALSMMLAVHRAAGTYQKQVDIYIALSEFARRKFIEGGLPEGRIVVKPNFVSSDPGFVEGSGAYALFVGRISEEKGVGTLAAAWYELGRIPLRVAGDGPLRDMEWPEGVTWLGVQPTEQIRSLMQRARVLVFPSTCYENAPMTILEAFACGLPVIASNLGSIPEFVKHRYNGLLFEPGDPQGLTRQVRWAFEHPEELRAMRVNARREYEEKYTPERNYKMLMTIYEMAINNSQPRRHEAS